MKGSKKTASGWKSDALFYFWMERERERESVRGERERERGGGLSGYNFITQLLVITS